MSQSTPESLRFLPIAGRTVRAEFDGGALSSDFGPLILRGVDQQIGCFCLTPRKGKTSPSPCFVRCVRSYRKRKSRHGLVRNRSVSVMRHWGVRK